MLKSPAQSIGAIADDSKNIAPISDAVAGSFDRTPAMSRLAIGGF
jgi:hypothetical protein